MKLILIVLLVVTLAVAAGVVLNSVTFAGKCNGPGDGICNPNPDCPNPDGPNQDCSKQGCPNPGCPNPDGPNQDCPKQCCPKQDCCPNPDAPDDDEDGIPNGQDEDCVPPKDGGCKSSCGGD